MDKKKQKTPDKCLIVSWNFPPKTGGMESLIYDIYKTTSFFIPVKVIAPKAAVGGDPNIIRPGVANLFYFFLFAVYMGVKELNKSAHSVVIGGSFLMAPVVYIIGLLTGSKRTCYIHGLDLLYRSFIYQFMVKIFINKFDMLYSNSLNTKGIAVKKGASPSRIEIINPFVSEEFTNQLEKSRSQSNNFIEKIGLERKKIVLSVGRLTERKGLPLFIERCFRFIVKELDDAIFLIAGEEPKEALAHKTGEKKKIEYLVEKYDLQNHVKLLGYTDSSTLKVLYNICDIFVFPGISCIGDVEGFGIVAIEAAAAGKLTIASSVGGVTDAVEHNFSGLLVKEGDYTSMLRYLKYSLNHPDFIKSMGNNAKIMAETTFSQKKFQEKWERIFSRLMA